MSNLGHGGDQKERRKIDKVDKVELVGRVQAFANYELVSRLKCRKLQFVLPAELFQHDRHLESSVFHVSSVLPYIRSSVHEVNGLSMLHTHKTASTMQPNARVRLSCSPPT